MFFESCPKRPIFDDRDKLFDELLNGAFGLFKQLSFEGFDPGSERTLAAWIRHASRTNPRGVTLGGKWRKGQ